MSPAHLVLAFSLAAFLAAPASASSGREVRLTNGEWPPYLSESLPDFGVASHIVTDAFAEQGITVRYGFFPWARSLALARSGAWDGTAVWLRSAERERDFFLSDPILESEYVFFHLKSVSFDWNEIGDLARYRIGISNDYFYGEEFENAVRGGRLAVEGVTSDEQNFRKLLWSRIDAFPMDRVVGAAMLGQRFSAGDSARIVASPHVLFRRSLHLLLSRKNPDNAKLMQEFNKGLRKLRTSRRLDGYLREAAPAN